MESLKTKSKDYREKIFAYLLNNISFEDAHDELTDRQKIEYLFSEFDRCANYNYNIKRIPNEQARLADWLQGLPSCINIEYTNHGILELAKQIHEVSSLTERQKDAILKNYFNHIAFMLISLRNKLSK